jgi:transposase
MLYVGIDIAKRNHEATIIDDKGKTLVKPFTFANTLDGFDKLLNTIHTISHNLADFEFGLEATGHYWLNLYCKLVDTGATAHVINPVQSDALRGLYIRQTKTDSKDALIIADLIRIGRYSTTTLAHPDLVSLRELTRHRFYLVDCISDAKHKVISLIDKVFPEYETIFTDMFGATSIALLEQYPTPDLLATLSTTKLANFLKSVSKGRFGRTKAEQIKALANNSFGTSSFSSSTALAVKHFVEQISLLEKQVADLENIIATTLPKFDTNLTTINGIGTTIAAIMVSEIGDIHRFDSPEKLAAFAGIDPSVNQSGEFSGTKSRMSKRGSPYLRRAFFLAAVGCLLHNPALKALYDKKKSQGKHHLVAISAVMRKLANIVFAVLKSNKPYTLVMPTAPA